MRSNIKFHLYFLFAILFILTYFNKEHFLFWDTVQLAGKHGLFFYENNFLSFVLPNEIDSGHIPFFGFYLAIIWKIFGKSLVVSHFAMLPFMLALAYYFYYFV
jgi:hypothetical protein